MLPKAFEFPPFLRSVFASVFHLPSRQMAFSPIHDLVHTSWPCKVSVLTEICFNVCTSLKSAHLCYVFNHLNPQ